MIEINKCKLIPGITSTWGDIVGDITNQKDLVDYVASHGGGGGNAVWGEITGDISDQSDLNALLEDYALKEWVESKGYLVQDDLSQYATRQWVTGRGYITSDALNGYATETWVGQQGYITSAALSGYATQDWVDDQGYIDQIKTVNNQSLVGEGNIEISGLTPEQEDALEPLMTPEPGMLYTRELDAYTSYRFSSGTAATDYKNYMYNLDGDIYCKLYQQVYKWNPADFTFNRICSLETDNYQPLWMDDSGRVYMGYQYEVDLETGDVTNIDLGEEVSVYYYYYSWNLHNIFKGNDGIYMVGNGKAFKFNEDDQEFEEITFNNQTQIDVVYWISLRLRNYEGHLVMVAEGSMYEFNEYEDRVELVEVSNPYFPVTNYNDEQIDSQNLHKIRSEYLYLKEYTHSTLDDGQWEHIEINIEDSSGQTYYWGAGVDYSDYLLGYNSESTNTVLVTTGVEGYESTGWTGVSAVAVDLKSEQEINGEKKFNSTVRTLGGLWVTSVNTQDGETRFDLGRHTTNASSIELTVSGLFTVNDKNIATTDDCIMNRQDIHGGPRFTELCNYPKDYVKDAYWTTPSGRLFSTDVWNTDTYEFDGEEFNAVTIDVNVPGNVKKVATTGGDLYANYNNNLYRWDDEDDTWVVVCESWGASEDIWTAGDTIRNSSDYVLSSVTNKWVYDVVQNWKGAESHLLNGHVYVNYENVLYEYSESTKTYRACGSIMDWGTRNWFVLDSELYYTGADNVVYKIDFSRDDQDLDLNVPTNILCRQSNQFYGTCQYSPYLYTTTSGIFGYCYDIQETVPEPEDGEGDYVLTASVDEYERVNYSWDKGNILKLVDKELDYPNYPVIDRPDDNSDPDNYNSAGYILSLSEIYDTIEEDGDDIRRKFVRYIVCEDQTLFQRQFEYHDVDGEWEFQNEFEYQPFWQGSGWEAAQIHYLGDDPDYQGKLDDFPLDAIFDIGWDKLPFGIVEDDGEALSFNGFCWDQENEKLGLYKVTPNIVPGVGLNGYDESFIPFVAAEEPDTSTDATYVLKATVLDGEVTYEWVPEV